MPPEENTETPTEEQIVTIIAKFKADILWDEIVGIFEKVPAEVKRALEKQYEASLLGAADKLGKTTDELKKEVDEKAFEMVNGRSFKQDDIDARLKEYQS
ncbi:MAG TPA: hypothetical protein V6C96_03525 [Vampirovibrionales bacterium]